jgi:hypothetical protein
MSTYEEDRDAVLAVNEQWWKANVGLDVPAMRACFPSGTHFSMYNRNSFTYFGVDEITALWEWFRANGFPPRITQTVNLDRVEVWGDTALIVGEATYRRVVSVEQQGWEEVTSELFASKFTEIYRRDDGDGNPRWTMWHFQSAEMQPWETPRTAFGDSRDKGEFGTNPYEVSVNYTVDLFPRG